MALVMKVIQNKSYLKYCVQRVFFESANALNKSNRHIHVDSLLHTKMYLERENKYAYNILEHKGYAISINTPSFENLEALSKEKFDDLIKTDWSKQPEKNIFDAFTILGDYCSRNNLCISDKIFDNYIDSLTDCLRLASDKELESIFYSLRKWPVVESIRTRNYIEVWVALDDVCMSRHNQWTFDEMLVFVSLFYMFNVSRISDFSIKCIQKLASKAKQLSPKQMVQTMFFVGVLRKSPFDMHNLEIKLMEDFTKFSVDDLAIMSMGFFKSKTPIRDMQLISKIIDVVIENAKSIHEVSLAALLKVIRYSIKINPGDNIYRLLDVLQYEVPRLSAMCNVHLALVATSTLTEHKGCLNVIAENILGSIESTRLKDLERLVLAYATFNMVPTTTECFFSKVVDELRKPEREQEIQQYGRSFACCISFLHILGIYPIDLMNRVLSPEFLEQTYGKQFYAYGREILAVHNSAQLFCADTKSNLLSDKAAKVMAKKYTDFVPNEGYSKQFNVSERMFLDVMRVLKENRGGDNFVVGDHILTHHQRGDIIICNSPNGQPLPVTDSFNDANFGLLRRPPDDNIWVALIIAGRNGIIHDSHMPTGHFLCKVRELRVLGFVPALVPWSIYSKLEIADEKFKYLNELINEAIRTKL